MEITKLARPFNLEHARAGAPFRMRNGEEVEVLKWDRKHAQCIVTVAKQDAAIRSYRADGTQGHGDGKFDLVMFPLGYIDGKPVFVGDELEPKFDFMDKYDPVPALPEWAGNWDPSIWRWPAPKPVYPETRMTEDELREIGNAVGLFGQQLVAIANAAIRHAIEQGQVVVPTADGAIDIHGVGVLVGDRAAVEHVAKLMDPATSRAARDVAIAEAVRDSIVQWADLRAANAYKTGYFANKIANEVRALDLAAIIAGVKEGA